VLAAAVLMRLGLSWTGGWFDELFRSLVLGLSFPEQGADDVSSRPMWAERPPVALRATTAFAADPDYRRLADWLERAPADSP
jgi:hypothetical protein